MQTLLGKQWCHIPQEEIAELLETDPQKGLDIFAVRHRQSHFGLTADVGC